MTTLHILCPVFHEQENLPKLWQEVEKHFTFPHVIHFITDEESDPTLPQIHDLQSKYPDRIHLHMNQKGGVLQAIIMGFDHTPPGVPVLILMADLSDDLAIVEEMISEWQRGVKIVVASRYMPGGRQVGGGVLKSGLSRLAGLSLYYFGKLPVRDATNNFRLYDSDFIHSIQIESKGGFELSLEITAKAVCAGYPVTEIPTIGRGRQVGESRFNLIKWLPHYLRWYFYLLRNG